SRGMTLVTYRHTPTPTHSSATTGTPPQPISTALSQRGFFMQGETNETKQGIRQKSRSTHI
nr:hypothetical protein [Corynebacterium amycolatum]